MSSSSRPAAADIQLIKSCLRNFTDFIPGINFVDIMPIFRDPIVVEALVSHLVNHVYTHTLATSDVSARKPPKIDVVVGLDARGFLFGPLVAMRLGAAFVPVRKKGKLPGKTVSASYLKEYGEDTFDMQADAITEGQHVVVLDDLIATGGSAKAAGELVEKLGGKVLEYLFVIELPFLKGASKLNAPAYSILQYDD